MADEELKRGGVARTGAVPARPSLSGAKAAEPDGTEPESGVRRRRIAVVTSSRAEYSHLFWVLRELQQRAAVELGVITMGAHHSPVFGNTALQVERDGFPVRARVECLLSSDSDAGMAKTIGVAVLGLADALSAWRPDLLMLIADRYEMLAPASAALALRIPMAHIEGGEVSQGAIDDAVRNALTKMAHVHFTSTETARQRVIAMGEEPWRVHRAGAPSIDHLKRSRLYGRGELEMRLGEAAGRAVRMQKQCVVAAFHPATILQNTADEAEEFFAAAERLDEAAAGAQLLFVYPNADAGSHELIRRARELATRRSGVEIFVNLDAVTYWSLLREADAMLGNSSSGIMEAASFELPVVNVGIRQQGRERAENVIDVPAEREAILAALRRAQSGDFRRSLRGMANPYGEGIAAVKIANVLETVRLDGILIKAPVPVLAERVSC
jgi:UDP-N-acetylglucosamine 2-epimerase (non-hydrolysing)/GDP/UDP-N,N'-diacetylbacillosamine 2-epimerase (hydrolysing)